MVVYHSETLKWPITLTQTHLEQISTSHGLRLRQVHFYLLSDEELREINRSHLNHDYYTDIITFPYHNGKRIDADIFISLDRVTDNASKENESIEREMARVIIHGVLHLCGYEDHDEKEKKKMRQAENHWINQLIDKKKEKSNK